MTVQFEGFPLSPQQRRLWSLIEAYPEAAFRSTCTVRLKGSVDGRRLQRSLETLVRRHEILRTVYRRLPGMQFPLQVITDAGLDWAEEDVSALSTADRERRIAELDGAGPLRLEDGPILASRLIRLTPTEHLLVLTVPALAADPPGLRNLVRELVDAYAGETDRDPGEETLQYADLAAWQNELLESGEAEAGREYWRRQERDGLLDLVLPLELPASSAAVEPCPHRCRLGVASGERAEALAGELGTPAAAPYLAAWQALLWRLTGRSAPIGTAFEGRRYPELRGVTGLLVRHLPVGAQAAPGLPFRALVERVGRSLDEAHEWQEGFDWSEWWGDGTAPESFPAVFAFEEARQELSRDGLRIAIAEERAWLERFVVRLEVRQSEGGPELQLEHDPGRIEEDEAGRLLERYVALLDAALLEPALPVDHFPTVGETERRELVEELNATEAELPGSPLLHARFLERAREAPDRVALVSEGAQVTYGELSARAERLARRLLKMGVGPGQPVGVCLERTPALVAALLGILEAGGAYVPLDPEQPDERLAALVADVCPRALVVGPGLDGRLREGVPRLVVDRNGAPGTSGDTAEPPALPSPEPEDLAYVLYTSGSTGHPKGVAVSHRAIRNRIAWMAGAFPWGSDETVIQKTPFGFDASAWGSARERSWPAPGVTGTADTWSS